ALGPGGSAFPAIGRTGHPVTMSRTGHDPTARLEERVMNTKWRSVHLAFYLGFVTLIASTVGAGWVMNRTRAGHSPTVLSDSAEPAIVGFGYVDGPAGVTALAPLVAGRVTRVEVQENEPVKAGSVLIRLDDRLAQFRVRQVEASLAAAREQLAQARKLPR